jgi:AcrR family transcriptional regulator
MPNHPGYTRRFSEIKFGACKRLQLVRLEEFSISGNITPSFYVKYATGNFEEDKSFHSFVTEMEVREKIVEKAAELYMQFGIRTVTMDDIARDLSISKKTIYQYFKDKRELVNTICMSHLEIESQRFTGASDESENSIHELMLVSKCLRESMQEMKVNIMNELKKFYPEAWKMYNTFKSGVMKESIMNVIIRGQKEGYFRSGLDPEMIAIMRMEQVESFIIGNYYPKDKYSLTEVQMQLFDHFIHGLFTIEGHQLFNQYNTTTSTNVRQHETLNK